MKKPTVPRYPWVIPPDKDTYPQEVEPTPAHMKRLIRDTLRGKVDEGDMAYMAKAILQMSDEIYELRERVRALEMALREALS